MNCVCCPLFSQSDEKHTKIQTTGKLILKIKLLVISIMSLVQTVKEYCFFLSVLYQLNLFQHPPSRKKINPLKMICVCPVYMVG